MSHSPFGQSKKKIDYASRPAFDEVTLDDFSGGLDLSESDLKLKSNFSKVENNVHRDVDGGKSVRWGQQLRYNMNNTSLTGSILDMVYFSGALLSFTTTGQIGRAIDSDTFVSISLDVVWNNTIAALLPGTPSGWSSGQTQFDWTEFKNELVICNGIDKPLLISKTYVVTYLQDIPTGSNVNTPIGKYCTTVGNYTVIAGVTATPDVIYISAAGTSGTWPGDPAPNDALSINIATYSAQQGGEIRGLSSFRNYLIVHFATSSVVMVLGEYNGAIHKPRVLDTIPSQGALSHRTVITLDSDMILIDQLGVYKAKRNAFGNAIEADKVSARVQPSYIKDVLSSATVESFAVHNKAENRIMIFLKQNNFQWKIYTMTFDEGLKKIAWNTFSGMYYTCGAGTPQGRVYFARDRYIFRYGNGIFTDEDYMEDRKGDPGVPWVTAHVYQLGDLVLQSGKRYVCRVGGVTSSVFANDLAAGTWEDVTDALPIDFEWEMPWTDANTRMRKKHIGYLGLDTVGSAPFTLQVYVDNYRYDENGDDDPALSLNFVAGDAHGYGNMGQPYGGGRRAKDERMWGFPVDFKIAKFRMLGSITERLKFTALSLLLTKGTFKR